MAPTVFCSGKFVHFKGYFVRRGNFLGISVESACLNTSLAVIAESKKEQKKHGHPFD
jgi:hypothetical protein